MFSVSTRLASERDDSTWHEGRKAGVREDGVKGGQHIIYTTYNHVYTLENGDCFVSTIHFVFQYLGGLIIPAIFLYADLGVHLLYSYTSIIRLS